MCPCLSPKHDVVRVPTVSCYSILDISEDEWDMPQDLSLFEVSGQEAAIHYLTLPQL